MKKGIREKFAEVADIPKDFVMDMARITLLGNRQIQVENYKSIVEYNNNVIRLAMNNKQIKICGNDLIIENLAEKTVYIGGNIISVEFCSKHSDMNTNKINKR